MNIQGWFPLRIDWFDLHANILQWVYNEAQGSPAILGPW